MTLVLAVQPTRAATRTWTGGSPTSGNWTIPGNWDGGASSPSNGDDLVFPAAAARLDNTNNFSNFRADSITFSGFGGGFNLRGNALTVSNGIAGAHSFGSNSIHLDLTLGASQAVHAPNTTGALGLLGDIALGAHTLTVSNRAPAVLGGVISGAGGLTKRGTNALRLAGTGANTYTGTTLVLAGVLALDKTGGLNALAGDLTIGEDFDPLVTLRLDSSAQIPNGSHITVYTNGLFDLNGFNETIGDLTLVGGDITTGTGTLTLAGDVLIDGLGASVPANFYGNLNLGIGTRTFTHTNFGGCISLAAISGSADWIMEGEGTFSLRATNTFTGSLTVNGGQMFVNYPGSLGGTAGGTVINSPGLLVLYSLDDLGLHFGPESLSLNSSNDYVIFTGAGDYIWDGPVQVTGNLIVLFHEGISLDFAGPISGSGGLKKEGNGTLIFSGNTDNTFAGLTHVADGTLRLAKTGGATAVAGEIRIGSSDPGAESLIQQGANQIADTSLVIMDLDAVWNLGGFNETIGNLVGAFAFDAGEIALDGGTLTIQFTNDFGHFPGTITGTGGFTKSGTGHFELDGDNTYTGSTLVQQGTLAIRGFQPASSVTVLTGATLEGDGTVGHVSVVAGGTLRPGAFALVGPNTLTTSNLTLNAGAAFATVIPTATNNGRVDVRGTAMITDANFAVEFHNYIPTVGEVFPLIVNDGADLTGGTFAGIPEGDFPGPNGLTLNMDYGNDVTLRLNSQGATPVAPGGSNYLDVVILGGNANGYLDPNECAQVKLPIFNDTTNSAPPFTAYLSCAVPGVFVNQGVSAYPALAPGQGAYGATPFQITTPPGLFCGSNLPATLVIVTTNNTIYVLSASLFVGAPGLAARYDSTEVPLAINDGVTVESVLSVAAFPGWVAHAEVSLHALHELTTDVHFTLVAPNGLEIPLAQKAGSGANYGAGCNDAQRTTFTMAAPQFVGDAAAPFTGAFRPEGNLNLLRGLPGNIAEGKWILRINDDTHFNTGTLQCWSLYLSPTTCTDGGGACDVCPGYFNGQLSSDDALTPSFIYNFGDPSVCYSNNVCDGAYASPRRYDAYNFTNHTAEPACVTVVLTSSCTNFSDAIESAAFLGAFNPASPCDGYLGDSGALQYFGQTQFNYEFTVPANTNLQVVVATAQDSEGCKDYTLLVNGPGLCPVTLNISTTNPTQMRLDWPTYAIGYQLETAPAVSGQPWTTITNEPSVSGQRYNVLHDVQTPTGLYRLHKP